LPKRRPPRKSRPDWTQPLLHPLTIPKVMKLVTLGDVRTPMEKHMPADFREKEAWQHVFEET
jgi:hypothetical protein